MIIIELMRIDSQIIIRCSIKNGGLVPFLDDTLVYTGIWILEEVFGDMSVKSKSDIAKHVGNHMMLHSDDF